MNSNSHSPPLRLEIHDLFQIVREPTRYDYLLDLAMTDMLKASAMVMPQVADHRGIMVKLPLPEFLEKSFARTVWILKKANWKKINSELAA